MFQAKQKNFATAIGKEIESMMAWIERFSLPEGQTAFRLAGSRQGQPGRLAAGRGGSFPAFLFGANLLRLRQRHRVYPGTYTTTDGSGIGRNLCAAGSRDAGLRLRRRPTTRVPHQDRCGDMSGRTRISLRTPRSGILTAVQVAQGKVAPQLVPMPLEAMRARWVGVGGPGRGWLFCPLSPSHSPTPSRSKWTTHQDQIEGAQARTRAGQAVARQGDCQTLG